MKSNFLILTIICFISCNEIGDGNPKPTYIFYDSDERTVEFKRFDYDLAKTQKNIIENGLPAYLADRLSLGK